MSSFMRRMSAVFALCLAACQNDTTVIAPASSADSLSLGSSHLILTSPPVGSTTAVFVGDSIQLASALSTRRGKVNCSDLPLRFVFPNCRQQALLTCLVLFYIIDVVGCGARDSCLSGESGKFIHAGFPSACICFQFDI